METTQFSSLAKYEHQDLEQKGLFRRCYYKPTQSPVKKEELFFSADDFTFLKSALEHKRFDAMKPLHRQSDGNVKLVVVHSKDGKFVAAQLQRYQPFDFSPETEIIMLNESEAKAFFAAFMGK